MCNSFEYLSVLRGHNLQLKKIKTIALTIKIIAENVSENYLFKKQFKLKKCVKRLDLYLVTISSTKAFFSFLFFFKIKKILML